MDNQLLALLRLLFDSPKICKFANNESFGGVINCEFHSNIFKVYAYTLALFWIYKHVGGGGLKSFMWIFRWKIRHSICTTRRRRRLSESAAYFLNTIICFAFSSNSMELWGLCKMECQAGTWRYLVPQQLQLVAQPPQRKSHGAFRVYKL